MSVVREARRCQTLKSTRGSVLLRGGESMWNLNHSWHFLIVWEWLSVLHGSSELLGRAQLLGRASVDEITQFYCLPPFPLLSFCSLLHSALEIWKKRVERTSVINRGTDAVLWGSPIFPALSLCWAKNPFCLIMSIFFPLAFTSEVVSRELYSGISHICPHLTQ